MATEKSPEKQLDPLRQIQKDVADLLKPFEELRRLKATDADLPGALARAAARLPAPEAASKAVADLRERGERTAHEMQVDRERSFGATLSAFIRDQRDKVGANETHDGWRVGRLEIGLRKDAALARTLYNHEALTEFRPIDSTEALQRLVQESEARLEKATLPDEVVIEVFWRAYRYLRAERKRTGKARADEVPIREFYAEVRVALVRQELRTGKANRKLAWAEFPEWAFLYNLDRYLALATKVPGDRRLRPQTGSQAEEARRMGMTVGGLKPTQDYKSYCYVVGPEQS